MTAALVAATAGDGGVTAALVAATAGDGGAKASPPAPLEEPGS